MIFLKVSRAMCVLSKKLDTTTNGTKRFSNPQALSSTLTPLAFGLLIPLVLVSHYYIEGTVLQVTVNMLSTAAD